MWRFKFFSLLPVVALLVIAGCSATETPAPVGLNVGNRAPELEGPDLSGKTIKLSNYRGKVVIVDFWATWCGPCRQMTPESKKLVQKMTARPFQFIGVSADKSTTPLKQYVDENEITWPNIFDGQPGSLALAWQIDYFPNIFVIDHKGVIRYRDLRGRDLDRVVEKLVAAAEKAES